MTYTTAVSVFAIAAAVAVAPLCSEVLRRWRIPSVLFELLFGILIGPEVLGWASLDPFVSGLSTLGICFLFFMAGYEIDFAKLSGDPLNRGIVGWLVSLVLGLGRRRRPAAVRLRDLEPADRTVPDDHRGRARSCRCCATGTCSSRRSASSWWRPAPPASSGRCWP